MSSTSQGADGRTTNPDGRTIRIYRQDGTTHLFRAADVIENEPLLPGFRLIAREVFPEENV
jgi:hypothetical protein